MQGMVGESASKTSNYQTNLAWPDILMILHLKDSQWLGLQLRCSKESKCWCSKILVNRTRWTLDKITPDKDMEIPMVDSKSTTSHFPVGTWLVHRGQGVIWPAPAFSGQLQPRCSLLPYSLFITGWLPQIGYRRCTWSVTWDVNRDGEADSVVLPQSAQSYSWWAEWKLILHLPRRNELFPKG